jgi:mannosidase alpha-like ER degradation enhancer 1
MYESFSVSAAVIPPTGNPQYASVARRAIRQLWSMRSELNLLGTTLNMSDATWVSTSGGIGASADSFYEYLLKGYLAFGGGTSSSMHACMDVQSIKHRWNVRFRLHFVCSTPPPPLRAGDVELYNIFSEAYSAVMQNYRSINHWYQESDIHSGQPTHRQFTSLQAFWPGE